MVQCTAFGTSPATLMLRIQGAISKRRWIVRLGGPVDCLRAAVDGNNSQRLPTWSKSRKPGHYSA